MKFCSQSEGVRNDEAATNTTEGATKDVDDDLVDVSTFVDGWSLLELWKWEQ